MKIIVFAITCLLIAGCNSSNDNEKTATDSLPQIPGGTPQTAAFAVSRPDSSQLPAKLRFRGRFYEAFQWTDKLGENILVSSIVDPYPQNEEERTAELHVFHFIKKEGAYKLLWKIADSEKLCPFDITAAFLKDATTITDLDRDGVAETTVQYKLACRSDVSPAFMKVIMHEDSVKYSLRGMMWIKASEKDTFTVSENDVNLEKLPRKADEFEQVTQSFGRYETEKEFAAAPAGFLTHARKQWMRYAIESFE